MLYYLVGSVSSNTFLDTGCRGSRRVSRADGVGVGGMDHAGGRCANREILQLPGQGEQGRAVPARQALRDPGSYLAGGENRDKPEAKRKIARSTLSV